MFVTLLLLLLLLVVPLLLRQQVLLSQLTMPVPPFIGSLLCVRLYYKNLTYISAFNLQNNHMC